MSRHLRETGEYLHVIVRGIGKQILFEDMEDNEKFLYYLQKYAKVYLSTENWSTNPTENWSTI